MGKTSGQRFISRLVSVQTQGTGPDAPSLFTVQTDRRAGEELARRFRSETQWLRAAAHPHLLRVLSEGDDGYRLAEPLLAEWPGDPEWLAGQEMPRRIVSFAQLASVVGGLHRAGRIHGVLHPDRCGLRQNGDLVLLDLGMTWWADGSPGGGDALFCCAPECLAGAEPDARADIYSLGGLLHWFLSGHTEAPRRGRSAPPTPLPAALAEFQPLLDFMTAERPAQRPSSVTMVLDQLNAILMRMSRTDHEGPGIERAVVALSALSQRPALRSGEDGSLPPSDPGRWLHIETGTRLPGWLWALSATVVVGAAVAIGVRMQSPQAHGFAESLAARAATQLASGRVLLPEGDNALDTLRTLRRLDPDHEALAMLTQRVESRAVESLEDAMRHPDSNHDIDAALDAALRAFPDNDALVELAAQLAQARRSGDGASRIQALLQRFDAWIEDASTATVEEALSALRQAAELAPGDAAVASRQRRLESELSRLAQAALAEASLAEAGGRLAALREAFPGTPSLSALSAEYERRYAAEDGPSQLRQLLVDAASAEDAATQDPYRLGHALDLYLQAQLLAPTDADAERARSGAARLGARAFSEAQTTAAAKDWAQAGRWLALAQRADSEAAGLPELADLIEQGHQAHTAEVRDMLDRAELARRRGRYFNGEQSAWALYTRAAGMLEDPREARAGLNAVRRAALADADALIARQEYTAAAALVRAALADIGSDAQLERRKLTLAALGSRPAATTTSPAVATGFLAINATPWAHVRSISRADNGRPVSLEGEASTPLRIALPAGDYRVELGDPEGEITRTLTVRVQAGEVSHAHADFHKAP